MHDVFVRAELSQCANTLHWLPMKALACSAEATKEATSALQHSFVAESGMRAKDGPDSASE